MTDQKSKSEKIDSWVLLTDQLAAAYRPRTAELIGIPDQFIYVVVTLD